MEDIEEGEIVDDDTASNYNLLERPKNYSTTIPINRFPIEQYSESEDETSDSDSDYDSKPRQAKKPKIKPRRPQQQQQQPTNKKKKYDIWSTRQEDVLSATLDNCDVSAKDRSRGVEGYDYTLSQRYRDVEKQRTSNKRSRDDRNNPNLRLIDKRQAEEEVNDIEATPRTILNLTVTSDNTPDEIACDIANKLGEEKEDLILNVINVAGKQKAFDVFHETQRIEKEGGMLIMNQTRRRTPGGVFLFLMRHDKDLSQEHLQSIFVEERQRFKQLQKMKKKQKADKLKQKQIASKKKLPEFLTRAQLCVQKLASENERTRKESTNIDIVNNPPPTPETDCHENSLDGMDKSDDDNTSSCSIDPKSSRKLKTYDVDYLDLGDVANMDTF